MATIVMTYKEAAHRLRMTVRLLKWFASYSTKNDSRKLLINGGLIDGQELVSFDNYLREAWPTRSVPRGVTDELYLQAAGKCGVCEDPCEHFEEAHIDRKGKEAKDYNQHPHNLILLCGSCHGRYDRGSTITNDVVRKRKDILLSRLMEDVDRDMALAQMVRESVTEIPRSQIADPKMWASWTGFLTERLFANRGGVLEQAVVPPKGVELQTWLSQTSRLLLNKMPMTSGTLQASADRLEAGATVISPTEAEAWEHIEIAPVEGRCLRCGQQTPLESYTCLSCDHWGMDYHGEVPYLVDKDVEPARVEFEDALGDSHLLLCEACGSDELELEFQPICDYCQHMSGKNR